MPLRRHRCRSPSLLYLSVPPLPLSPPLRTHYCHHRHLSYPTTHPAQLHAPRATLHRAPLPASLSENPPSPTPSQSLSKTLAALRQSSLVLCIRSTSAPSALLCAHTAIAAGITSLEITLTTPSAPAIIAALVAAHPHALIGAGTVLTPSDASLAISSGAAFAMSPVTSVEVISACNAAGVLAIPGAATPTEVYAAHTAGAKMVKIFPVGPLGGVGFVQKLVGPLRDVLLLPTSGVAMDDVGAYLQVENVVAVGVSTQILEPDAVVNGQWGVVRGRAKDWVRAVAKVRPQVK